MDIKKTANSFANFTIKRIAEILGITVFGAGVLLLLALLTYSPEILISFFQKTQK